MIIKILGSGCKKCVNLADNAKAALSSLGLQAEVVKITDVAQIAAHGVMSTPALVINDTVVSAGKVLSSEEISRLLPIN